MDSERYSNPAHIADVLRSCGFAPGVEDRLRRLELAIAMLTESVCREMEIREQLHGEIDALRRILSRRPSRVV